MKIQLLPSTIEDGIVTNKQHLSCFVVDDTVAIDAGCLSLAVNADQRNRIRDIVLTHAHIDHVAGLPLFIDDLFSDLKEPVRVHAAPEVIEILRKHIFNWQVYPDFAELENDYGPVLEYRCFEEGVPFKAAHLTFYPIPVNHKVPSCGFVVRDGKTSFALTGDTAEMREFWSIVNEAEDIATVFVECAFPDRLEKLAIISHHMTPARLGVELGKLKKDCRIFVINIKPVFRDVTVGELEKLEIEDLSVLDVGRTYVL